MFNVLSYLVAILITIVLTYTFNTRESFTLLYMLIIAPVFDFIVFTYMKKSINVYLSDIAESIEKREEIISTVVIENKGKLPIPFIQYEMMFSNKFICGDERGFFERISIGPKDRVIEEYTLFAAHRGKGTINLNEIKIKSLLGLFSKKIVRDGVSKSVMIIPALVEVEGVEGILEDIRSEDDNEDNTSNMFMGDPSYDFKEYSPGDPLNRVNWKISAKKNILMIRKSSIDKKIDKVIILDPAIIERGNYEEESDILIETLIGLAKEFFLLDYGVEIYFSRDTNWEKIKFIGEDIISGLQNLFGVYNFRNVTKFNNRFHNFNGVINKEHDYVLFTNNKDSQLEKFAKLLEEEGNSATIISNSKNKLTMNEYYLNPDYSLERV